MHSFAPSCLLFTLPALSPHFITHLTNNDLTVLREIVLWNLQVQRRRTLSYAARDIVVRTVARAEPASKVTSLANWHASQVRADTQHDKPFGLLNTVFVGLGVAQGFPLGVLGFFDFTLGTVADEDGLASPFDNDLVGELAGTEGYGWGWRETYVLALGNGSEIDLDLGLGEDVGGGGHVDKEVC